MDNEDTLAGPMQRRGFSGWVVIKELLSMVVRKVMNGFCRIQCCDAPGLFPGGALGNVTIMELRYLNHLDQKF